MKTLRGASMRAPGRPVLDGHRYLVTLGRDMWSRVVYCVVRTFVNISGATVTFTVGRQTCRTGFSHRQVEGADQEHRHLPSRHGVTRAVVAAATAARNPLPGQLLDPLR